MTRQVFYVDLELAQHWELTLDECFPDGAPENPTPEDVIAAMKASGDKTSMLNEWMLLDEEQITITVGDGTYTAEW